MRKVDFASIEDAPTNVLEAKIVEASDENPAYCRVTGYVWPQIGFELRLPLSDWNGKFVEVGCGGYCGNLSLTVLCSVYRGYACISSNMGHQSSLYEGLWAYDNWSAEIAHAYRSAHAAALAGKALVAYYCAISACVRKNRPVGRN